MKKLLLSFLILSSPAFATYAGTQPANRALVTNSSGQITSSATTSTQITYLSGTTTTIVNGPESFIASVTLDIASAATPSSVLADSFVGSRKVYVTGVTLFSDTGNPAYLGNAGACHLSDTNGNNIARFNNTCLTSAPVNAVLGQAATTSMGGSCIAVGADSEIAKYFVLYDNTAYGAGGQGGDTGKGLRVACASNGTIISGTLTYILTVTGFMK